MNYSGYLAELKELRKSILNNFAKIIDCCKNNLLYTRFNDLKIPSIKPKTVRRCLRESGIRYENKFLSHLAEIKLLLTTLCIESNRDYLVCVRFSSSRYFFCNKKELKLLRQHFNKDAIIYIYYVLKDKEIYRISKKT